MAKLVGLFMLDSRSYDVIYGDQERVGISELLDIRTLHESLQDAEVIMSGWGGPKIDQAFLDSAPNLKAVFYGAGSIKGIVTEPFWTRGVRITSAYAANAEPVAEYTLSQILFSLKRGWYYALVIKRDGAFPARETVPGAYGSVVGVVSLGVIGRRVCELLRSFELKVIAYDPLVSKKDADALGVELCSLEDVFRRSDVVSLHAPWLPDTEGMITGEHFSSMKTGATFVNTSRGAIVREREMVEVLSLRPDLWAVLDVTHPEPPAPGDLLFTLPNVVLTPHIAGSLDGECRRMGRYMVDELRRYLAGEPLMWEITREKAVIMA